MATKRRKKPLSDLEHGALEVQRQLRELGVAEAYAPVVVFAPGHKKPLPDERWPRVFRALYEAVDYIREMLHRGVIDEGMRTIIVLTDGYSASAPVWDSRRDRL